MLASMPARTPTISQEVLPRARALGDPTRFRIFRYVLEANRPVGVAELTNFVQLNHNAVRQHLAVLATAGLVSERTEEQRSGPGRPRLLYEVAPEVTGTWEIPGPYEFLATLLSEILATGDSPEEVGRRAGRRRADEIAHAAGADPVATIERELARTGFRPTLREGTERCDVVLGNCPFERAALANRAAVCSVHRGLAKGLAEGLGDTVVVDDLVARNPSRAGCRVLLHRRLPDEV